MNLELTPKAVLVNLLYFLIFLFLCNIGALFCQFYFGHDTIYGLVPLFKFNDENNIPTLYSSIALLFSAALLFSIAINNKKSGDSYLYWLWLAVIFIFLSIDETASIHERFKDPTRELLNAKGLFYFAWVIPYGLAVTLFLIFYIRFLIILPRITMILFVVSGFIYVLGAIGLEMVSGMYAELHGTNTSIYETIATFEELFEMLGVIVFIYALLSHIKSKHQGLVISVK